MKRIVGILALILAFSTVLILMIGCNGDNNGDNNTPVYKDYSVTVTDGLGNPMANMIVTFKNEAGESKMRVTEKDGIATYKNAIAGNYTVTVELGPGNDSTSVLQSTYTLTKDITSTNVIVRDLSKTIDIYGDVPENSFAYHVGAGEHSVICNAGNTSYVVFYAQTPGIYKVTFTSDDEGMTIGHYGIPMFVQSTHCGELNYDGKSFELVIKDQTTPYLLGVNATKATTATLKIERIGEAPFDPIYDAEWIEVESTATITKCDLGGKILVDLDITSDSITVSLGEDGYYYTNDGKQVYVRITTPTGHGRTENFEFIPVLGGSLALLAGYADENVGINIGGYVYDENGNFVNKYRYNEMIRTYMDYVDGGYGVVALNEELAECIKLHGEANGWFKSASGGYLFEGIDVNPENAWLFLCMVEE